MLCGSAGMRKHGDASSDSGTELAAPTQDGGAQHVSESQDVAHEALPRGRASASWVQMQLNVFPVL